MDTNLIQVLWVEDDPDNIQFYPIEASRYGLELVPFSCWEEAEKALVSDFKRWSAIILDAKCKYKKDDHDNALTRMLTDKHDNLAVYVVSLLTYFIEEVWTVERTLELAAYQGHNTCGIYKVYPRQHCAACIQRDSYRQVLP